MDTDPLIISPANTHLQNLLRDEEMDLPISQSVKNRIIFGEIEDPFPQSPSQSLPSNYRKKSSLHRSRTAPAMAVMRDIDPHIQRQKLESNSIIKQALIMLFIYLSFGVAVYSLNRELFSGVETHPVIDAFYFCIVTMCTIGYGDIAPLTPATKAFACIFVLFGFGLVDSVLSAVVNYVLDLQENMILANIRVGGAGNYIVDTEKGRMRIRTKVGLALLVVISCIGTGTLVLYFVENLDWIDSIYLSVMSVTTVGYGDRAFKTLPGRLFASLWLLVSTLAVARAFLYLAEARIDKRHRRITKLVLHRDMTVEEFLAADVNNNGFISKSEYVLYKLKELGKIADKDIQQICTQFNKLDPNNSGRITLPDLLGNRR